MNKIDADMASGMGCQNVLEEDEKLLCRSDKGCTMQVEKKLAAIYHRKKVLFVV